MHESSTIDVEGCADDMISINDEIFDTTSNLFRSTRPTYYFILTDSKPKVIEVGASTPTPMDPWIYVIL